MIQITETNVTIMTRNMDAAIAFYEAIGFNLKQRWDNHYAMLGTTGLTIGLHPASGAGNESSGTLSIGLMVDDINAAKSLLEEQSIAHTQEDDGKSRQLHSFPR